MISATSDRLNPMSTNFDFGNRWIKNRVQHGVKVAQNYAKKLHFFIHCQLVVPPLIPQLLKTCTPRNARCQVEDFGLMTSALTEDSLWATVSVCCVLFASR